jgi:hypothetical protein
MKENPRGSEVTNLHTGIWEEHAMADTPTLF